MRKTLLAFVFTSLIIVALHAKVDASTVLQDDSQVKSCKSVIVNFFEAFLRKELEVQFLITNGEETVPMIKAKGVCFSDGSMRWLEALQRRSGDLKVVDIKELLMNREGQVVTASSSSSSGGHSTKVTIVGNRPWRKEAIDNQLRTFWYGYFWTGSDYQQVIRDEFWEGAKCSYDNKLLCLTVTKSSNSEIVFKFSKEKGKQLDLVKVTQNLSVPSFESLRYEYEIRKNADKVIGWKIRLGDLATGRSDDLSAEIISAKTVEDQSSPILFATYSVPDGAEAYIVGKRNIHFEYHGGKVSETVDRASSKKIRAILNDAAKRRLGIEPLKNAAESNGSSPPSKQPKLSDYLNSSSYPHCGAYSMAAACASLGVDVSVIDLLNDPEVGHLNGASISGLRRFGNELGLHSRVITNGTHSQLASETAPVLLHFGKSYQEDKKSHWVVLLGIEEGKFRILDLPNDEVLIEPATLHAAWDGTGIVFSLTPVETSYIERLGTFSYVGVLLLIPMLVLHKLNNEPTVGVSAISLAGLAIASSIVWLWLSPISYANNGLANRIVESKVASKSSLKFSFPEMKDPPNSDWLPVDCRLAKSFNDGHLPESVSFPLTSKTVQIVKFCEEVPTSTKIAVYCKSETCQWSHKMATKLSALGYSNVSIYEPGWEGYCKLKGGEDGNSTQNN